MTTAAARTLRSVPPPPPRAPGVPWWREGAEALALAVLVVAIVAAGAVAVLFLLLLLVIAAPVAFPLLLALLYRFGRVAREVARRREQMRIVYPAPQPARSGPAR